MKILGIVGILLILLGGLALIIGLIVCFNTWTSDYATSTCERAARDREAIFDARERCGSTSSDCYKEATIGLTTREECEEKTAFMNRQLLMGIVPAVIGALLAFVGLLMAVGGFFFGRKKAAATA
jgi:ABC-type antimicrobial peptide transport system permease subunit